MKAFTLLTALGMVCGTAIYVAKNLDKIKVTKVTKGCDECDGFGCDFCDSLMPCADCECDDCDNCPYPCFIGDNIMMFDEDVEVPEKDRCGECPYSCVCWNKVNVQNVLNNPPEAIDADEVDEPKSEATAETKAEDK